MVTYKKKSWRDFQSDYIVKKRKKDFFLTTAKVITGLLFLLILITVIFISKIQAPKNKDGCRKTIKKAPAATSGEKSAKQTWLSKNQLNQIISTTKFTKMDKNIFFLDTPETSYKITTSIDVDLQEYLLSVLDRLKNLTRGKPQRIAFVVMEADTGKIIAMTGFDLENPDANPCIASNYPAASIFKIVTASAAVETLGYTPRTPLYFNGNKYTLYKRQLNDVKNKYSCKISFSRAFAESVNPVFGKIGKNHLGKKKLESYADAFGFNQVVHSEIPFFVAGLQRTTATTIWLNLGADLTRIPLFHRYSEPCSSRPWSTPATSFCPVLLNM